MGPVPPPQPGSSGQCECECVCTHGEFPRQTTSSLRFPVPPTPRLYQGFLLSTCSWQEWPLLVGARGEGELPRIPELQGFAPHRAPTAQTAPGPWASGGEQRRVQNRDSRASPAPAQPPGAERQGGSPGRTCEDGHAVEAAVQLAEQDGQEAVCGQHAGIPRALVIDHHVLRLRGLHLGAGGRGQATARHLLASPPPAATTLLSPGEGGQAGTQPCTPAQVSMPTATRQSLGAGWARGTPTAPAAVPTWVKVPDTTGWAVWRDVGEGSGAPQVCEAGPGRHPLGVLRWGTLLPSPASDGGNWGLRQDAPSSGATTQAAAAGSWGSAGPRPRAQAQTLSGSCSATSGRPRPPRTLSP